MRARTARWVAGCTAAGSVALIGGGVALAYVDRHLVPASLTGWTVSNISVQLVNVAVSGRALSLLPGAREPDWLAVPGGGSGAGPERLLAPVRAARAGRGPGVLASGPGGCLAVQRDLDDPGRDAGICLLLFPTGHARSRRWRRAGWFIGGAFTLANVWLVIAATRLWSHPFTSPFTQAGSPVGGPALDLITAVLISAALLVSVAAVVVRFVKSSGEERLQLKWCAAAALLLVVVFVASIWVNSAAVNVLQSLAFLCLWTAIAIAVLKYRLYDIDRIISRTLAYAIVTGLLIGVYAGLVLLATEVLQLKSPVAVAGSTLVAAALFSPLRSRVQRTVDRRFNRARYDADQMVAAFAARLKDAVDLDAVQADLASVVQRALEPAHVSVWMKPPRVTSRVLSLARRRRRCQDLSEPGNRSDARRQPVLQGTARGIDAVAAS